MPNIENLRGHTFRDKPERINRKGRPKMPDLKEAIAKILAEEKDGMTALDAVLKALRAKAVKGDVRAAQELLDRAFGKAKQSIDHTTDGTPIKINLIPIIKNDFEHTHNGERIEALPDEKKDSD